MSLRQMRLLVLSVVLALFVPVVAAGTPAGHTDETVSRLQPALRTYAIEHPEAAVQVIVQKQDNAAGIEAAVATLGGTVVTNLDIINAFAATMPASAVHALATVPGVRWVSLDAPVQDAGCRDCFDTSRLIGSYVETIGADRLWNEAGYLQGQGITVAIVDSGIDQHGDLQTTRERSRIRANVTINQIARNQKDWYGHGTHVAGIVGGNGRLSQGRYVGVAPGVNLVNVKVSDDDGKGTASDVVAGLQWVLDHKNIYNIRVVNLSLNSSVPESYHTNPINAAVEILWFNGIVVTVSAGNNSGDALYPPANDPFAITVGATDDHGTPDRADDVRASFSPEGVIENGITKPDIMAPGTNIVSLLPTHMTKLLKEHRDHAVGGKGKNHYFRMSGTSMASAATAGAAAILLQDEPYLTPDQVKYRLMETADPLDGSTAGYLNLYSAVHGTSEESANSGIEASQLLWSGSEPPLWNSVNWNSVNWNSVNWNSVNWNSVNWNSVNWNSVHWED